MPQTAGEPIMAIALRPLTTGELLDRTFMLYRNNFMLFAGIATVAAATILVAMIVMLVLGITLPAAGRQPDPAALMRFLGLNLGITALFSIFGVSLATGATIYAVSKVHLGQLTTIGESYTRIFPRLGRIILIVFNIILRLLLLTLVLFVCLFVVVFITGIFLGALGGRTAGMFGFVIGLLGGLAVYALLIRLYLQYSLSIQACLLENTGVNDSVKRSSFLAKGSLWRIFLIYLLMGIIAFALNFALNFLGNLLFGQGGLAAVVWQFAATFVAYTISFPISTIAISLVYYDQRVRKEAFDLQLMMEAVGQQSQVQAAAAVPPIA